MKIIFLTRKKKLEILRGLATNYIIADETLKNATIDSEKSCKRIQVIIDNTLNVACKIDGAKAMSFLTKIIGNQGFKNEILK